MDHRSAWASASTPKNMADVYVAVGQLTSNKMGLLRPSSADLPTEMLRQRLQEEGYLFIKGLFPRSLALTAREAYFNFLSPAKVTKPDSLAVNSIFDVNNDLSNFPGLSSFVDANLDQKGEQAAAFVDRTNRAHVQQFYRDFCQHPDLINFITKLTSWSDVRQFERSLLRCNPPHSQPIGVHYDQIFLRQGEITNFTAWFAMGDIKINGGGLMCLEKSK